MSGYSGIKDKIIIFACCLIAYLYQSDVHISVVTALISIIFSGFLSYFDGDRLRTALMMGLALLSCLIPELIFFLPLIAYDMFLSRYQYIHLLGVIPFIYFLQSFSRQTSAMVVIVLFLCILLKYRSDKQTKLHSKYNELNDAMREMSIQLKKQNQDLIEKQDNELTLATLNERNRIAREIHDNVGHLLSSAILQSGALLAINRDENVRDHLKTLNDTLSHAMNSIRASVHGLYDESIDLDVEIGSIMEQFSFCEINYVYHIDSNPGKKIKYAFISIVKEALANIARHSNASHASITFREHPALYQLIIRDNGKAKGYKMDDGLGLKNMFDRVHSLNGNMNIIIENGFEIFISVPKEGAVKDESVGCR